jgi:hypothetical protein
LRHGPPPLGRADHSCGNGLPAGRTERSCRLRESRPGGDDIIDQQHPLAVHEWRQPLGDGECTGEVLGSGRSRQSRLISDKPGMMQDGQPQRRDSGPAQLTNGRPGKRCSRVVAARPDRRAGGGDRNQQELRCRPHRHGICVRRPGKAGTPRQGAAENRQQTPLPALLVGDDRRSSRSVVVRCRVWRREPWRRRARPRQSRRRKQRRRATCTELGTGTVAAHALLRQREVERRCPELPCGQHPAAGC